MRFLLISRLSQFRLFQFSPIEIDSELAAQAPQFCQSFLPDELGDREMVVGQFETCEPMRDRN